MQCAKFAHDSILTNVDEYSRRQQTNFTKIFQDIVSGKVSEFGIHKWLKEKKGIVTNPPDISIYNANDKSFEADLISKSYKFHIKSQTVEQSKIYSESWSFDVKDPLTYNPDNNDIIIFCVIDDLTIYIKKMTSAKNIIPYYEKPIKSSLKRYKKVIYLKNIS